jgi:hypothetical protein
MSTATIKRSHADALADAEAFRALFPVACYSRWEFAGSLRRGRSEVSDVEHVIIPAIGEIPGGGLFAEPQRVNLLWHRLDALYSGRQVEKHLYGSHHQSGAPLYRWGEKHRGVDFRGFNHEMFCAHADGSNWGPTLAIRTGPAEFSERLVTQLRRHGRRNHLGYVWNCDRCPACGQDRVDKQCELCDGTNLQPVERLSVPDERTYFALAGVQWAEPRDRR